MKKVFLLTILLSLTFIGKAQNFLSLDSCRALALANNKDLLISNEKINAAHYQRKAAFTNYLPNFSATGAYMRNQKEFSLLNNDQKATLSGLGTNLAGPIQQAATEIVTAHPELKPQRERPGKHRRILSKRLHNTVRRQHTVTPALHGRTETQVLRTAEIRIISHIRTPR